MSSISSMSASSNGFSGLVSGMDTTTLVEQMLEGTQFKIDSQNEELSTLALKQSMYRDVSSQLLSFQSKFFDFANPTTNLLSSTFYNQNNVDISDTVSNFLSVEATTSYSGEQLSMDYIRQLATATTVTSADTLTDASINGTVDLSALTDTSIKIGVVGGGSTDITLTGSTAEEVRASLESGLAAAGIELKEDEDGALSLVAKDGGEVEVLEASALATKMTGLSNGEKGEELDLKTNTAPDEVTLKVNLDGVTKNISVSTSISSTEELVDSLNESITNAFGNGIKVSASGDEIKFETVLSNGQVDKNRQLTLTSDDLVATNLLGVSNNASSKVSTSTKLSDINFTNAPTTDEHGLFEFNINGVDFTFNEDATLKYIMDEVNDSSAGVTMSYSSLSDKITIERNDTGEGLDIEMSDTSGNLLSSLFGTGSETSAVIPSAPGRDDLLAPEGEELNITLSFADDFPPVAINIAGKTMSQVAEEMEQLIRDNQAPPEANVSYDADTGRLTITGVSSSPVLITGSTPEDTAKLAESLGVESISFGSSSATMGNKVEGQNAIISINGTETERNSNTFDIAGLNVELKETTWDGGVGTEPEAIDIKVDQDIDAIIDGVMQFVEEYNKIIEELNALVDAPDTYKDYPPLTQEQKNEMTDNEIALWEERSKEGLLRNDDIINDVLQEMRTALYDKPDDAQYALYEFGIATSENWQEAGKLVVDETLLREMVQKNPEDLQALFTGEDGGIATTFDEIIDAAAKQSSASPGSLVATAGFDGMTSNQYTIGREMDSIADRIEQLERTYEMEHDRYWSEFNAMEQMIADMNSQSSWLASQF